MLRVSVRGLPCHGNEFEFRRPCLEREVQLDVRVHCSSCGTLRDVVHSPLVGSTIAAGVFASRSRVVVGVSLLMVLRFCMGLRFADDWKIHHLLFPVPRGR